MEGVVWISTMVRGGSSQVNCTLAGSVLWGVEVGVDAIGCGCLVPVGLLRIDGWAGLECVGWLMCAGLNENEFCVGQ